MKRIRVLILRLAGLFSKERRERELEDEIESHIQMHIEDNLRSGMTPEQARREAIRKLGGVELAKQAYRDGGTIPFLENLMQDLRFAIRQLRKNPGFTGAAIFVLAIGMCASVAIFAFVDAALIKPLPYQNPGRLVGVYESVPSCPQCNLSYLDYLDWKKLNKVFSSLDVYNRTGFILSAPAGAEPARGARVSDGFFRTLGVTPALGRDFYAGEDLPSASRTVILSYRAWQKWYGGKEDVLGQTVTLDGIPNVIIGVLPPEFHFAPAEPAEFWTALQATRPCEQRRSCHNLYGVARLKDGVTVGAALADVTLIAQQLEKQYPNSNRGQGAAVMALSEVIVGDIRPILLTLLGGAGLLLLIATVNVASLLLVRSESRRREIALRSALGASPARLARLFVTEGVTLVMAGGSLGLASAYWLMRLLTRLIPTGMLAGMSYLHGLGLNARVLAFGGVISLLAAALFSITPTLRLSLSEMREGLAESSRGSAGTIWRRLGSKLVVVELATAVVLLVAAGLLGKSLYRLLHVDIGFQPEHLATMEVNGPRSSYAKDEQAIALERQVVSRIASLPGVKFVGVSADGLPVSHNGNTTWFRVLGRPWNGEHNEAPIREVSADYFTALGAKLLRGRYFTEAEDMSKPRVTIINQTMARQYFPDEDPVGKQISLNLTKPEPMEIVGIVENIREGPLDTPVPPVLYVPFNQSTDNSFGVVVRTSQDEESLLPAMAAAIHQIDPGIVTSDAMTMNDRINDSQSAYLRRSSAWLVGGFAALALLLSVVGLYGVVAYSVSQRTREIGVRMALGAQRSSVYLLILKEAGGLTAVGIIAGLFCSLAAATLMRTLLFGVNSWDISTLITVAAVLGASALIASYIPARRAASVNPVEALRAE
ncbi:MAG TPA: ABC transporter permease [Blastocatellia bacterium]|jgi:predicted permease|nr:ABC transporter permease [Blastocatellia bacterium]